MVRGRSKAVSKAGKGKGKVSYDSSNDDEIISAATSEKNAECGTVVIVNMHGYVPSDNLCNGYFWDRSVKIIRNLYVFLHCIYLY